MNGIGKPARAGWRRGRVAGRRALTASCAAALGLLAMAPAAAYDFWKVGAGRADFQAAGRYDLAGIPWAAQAGNPLVYDFGDMGLGTGFLSGVGLDVATINAAATGAGDAWETWANISFGDASGMVDSAPVRLLFDGTAGKAGAETRGVAAGVTERTFAEIVFYSVPAVGGAWTAENFQWTLMHELGHVIGLDDLYLPHNEEFVDHPVAGTDRPDLREPACQDNVMDRYNSASGPGNCTAAVSDYSKAPTTLIDNDEIAGAAWLWGSPFNQIVTGSLGTQWLPGVLSREVLPHHGDEAGNDGWWTYRGSISTPGDEPCIGIEFPGFEDWAMTTFPQVPIRFDGDLFGNGVQQVCLEASGWVGNFELKMKSKYTTEDHVSAILKFNFGDQRLDLFNQTPDQSGLTFAALDDTHASWAMLFGPRAVPEAGTLALLAAALAGGLVWVPSRRRPVRQCMADT